MKDQPAPSVAATPGQALSLAFMRQHPARAAGVLEALSLQEATQLFERVPARVGAAVLAAMQPHRAALCLSALDDARVQELIAALGTQPMVALLRQLPDARRQRLVAGLPTAAALATSLLLGFAEDALGAWADPDVVMLGAETRVADALQRARDATLTHPMVFVADATRRLVGFVPLASLLSAPALATLATLLQPPVALLAANGSLASAAAHPGWARASVLPVVEPGDRLVGVLTSDALQRALQRAVSAPTEVADGSALHTLARGYWQALAGLMDLALAALPRVPPALPPDSRGVARRTPGQEPTA